MLLFQVVKEIFCHAVIYADMHLFVLARTIALAVHARLDTLCACSIFTNPLGAARSARRLQLLAWVHEAFCGVFGGDVLWKFDKGLAIVGE